MPRQAPRLPARPWFAYARGALLGLGLWLAAPEPALAEDAPVVSARFTDPTRAYRHGVLGDDTEYSGLSVGLSDGSTHAIRFPEGGRVFEDLAPRLWDVTGDGHPEIVVIETDPPVGAQLAIYGVTDGKISKIAATPHIGRTHRWLAPLGAADLDGDGHVEIAYVDRPHLAKTLRIWRFREGRLEPVADQAGLTNHRIGEDFISGGLRDCGEGPEIVTADANWSRVMASTLGEGRVHSRAVGPYSGPQSLADALACR